MTTEESINKLIRDVINLILATPGYAIKAKQEDAPRPTGGYCTVDWGDDRNIGWEQSTLENNVGDDDLTETIEGLRAITLTLDFFRTGAIDNCRAVRTGLIRESIQSVMKAAGMGLTSRTTVIELSESFENGWEERAQFNVVLNAVGTDSDIIRSIAGANIAAEFQARGLRYNFTIEV